jgi:hypothetical protein
MFKKQEPWEQTIKAVKAFFDKKGIRYTENGKRLNMRYDANNYNDQNFTLIFDDDGDSVALRAFSILKYTSAQIEQAHAQCNKQNCDYRWARFYVDNDNELTLAVDAVIPKGVAPDICYEILARSVNILDDVYRSFLF